MKDATIAALCAVPIALPLFFLWRRMRKTEADMATKKKATKTEKPTSASSELDALREYFDATHTSDGDRVAAAKAAVHKARGE